MIWDSWLAFLFAGLSMAFIVSAAIFVVAFVQTADVSDVRWLAAIKAALSGWRRRDKSNSSRSTDEVMRAMCRQRMSPGYARNKREKIRNALTHNMPPLSWVEQCWLYEQAFDEPIVPYTRSECCHDEGCDVCQPRGRICE